MAKPLPTQTTFANQAPPWQLTQLDTDLSNVYSAVNDIGTYSNVLLDTGSVNAMIANPPGGITFSLVTNNQIDLVVANTTTSATPTLNVGSTGAKTLVDNNGGPLTAGALIANARYTLVYDGTSWRVMGSSTWTTTQTTANVNYSGTSEVYASIPMPIAANSLYPGSTIRITWWGNMAASSAGTFTLTERIRVGTTGTISDTAAVATQSITVTAAGATNANYKTTHYINFRAVGVSGTFFHQAEVYGLALPGGGFTQGSQGVGIDGSGATANTTVALFAGLTIQSNSPLLTTSATMILAERLY